jgi:uncharacterized surface protein with fasciclin (FAS1) repeats
MEEMIMKTGLLVPLGIAGMLLSMRAVSIADMPKKTEAAKANIIETAVAAGSFNTLVSAVKAAGLVETLSGPDPFTVFAPTDEAFAKLPEETIESLLADKPKLTGILTYHVVPGSLSAKEVTASRFLTTVNGASLAVSSVDGARVDNAAIVKTDIQCANGTIHVIDAVVLPKDLIETVVAAGQFNTLAKALEAAGLIETLRGAGPFTVFAPTDEAFAKLPKGTLESLLADKQKLSSILTYHVVPGRVDARDVTKLTSAKTVQGKTLAIDAASGVKVDGANVVLTDVGASNGVIHVIDQVLIPN